MIQFECPRVIYPLVSFTFGVHCGESISLYAGKGNCCIWPVNRQTRRGRAEWKGLWDVSNVRVVTGGSSVIVKVVELKI